MTFTTSAPTLVIIPSAKFKFTDNEESLLSRITVIIAGVYTQQHFQLRHETVHTFCSSANMKLFVWSDREGDNIKGDDITRGGYEIRVQNFYGITWKGKITWETKTRMGKWYVNVPCIGSEWKCGLNCFQVQDLRLTLVQFWHFLAVWRMGNFTTSWVS